MHYNLVSQLTAEKEQWIEVRDKAIRFLKKAPEGFLKIIDHEDYTKYYQRLPGDRVGKYIPRENWQLARDLAQKKYYEQLLKLAEEQVRAISGFLAKYDPGTIQDPYLKSSPARRRLITPVRLPDDEYAREWQIVEYDHMGFEPNAPEHYTARGERVRSKSEVMIANALAAEGIPYRYEYPAVIASKELHPDFTILDLITRRTIYWEHLGLMDNDEYRYNALRKLALYESDGIFIGDGLIVTFETSMLPLNINTINAQIRHFLK